MLNEDSKNADQLLELLQQLTQIAPTYFSLGNHELSYIETKSSSLIQQLTAINVHVLEDSYEDIVVQDNTIRIGGMYNYAFGFDQFHAESTKEFLEDFTNTQQFKLMLCHRPDSFVLNGGSKDWDIDLVVSGHDHGGQVILPFLGGLYGGDQGWFPKYVTGMHEIDRIHMIISNGLGSDKQVLPRFNNPPEIVTITVQPAIDDDKTE